MPAGQDEIDALGCSVVAAPGTGARPASAVEVAGAAAAGVAAGGVRTLKVVLKAAREVATTMGLVTAAAAGLAKPEARRKHVRQIMAIFPGEGSEYVCGNCRRSAAGKHTKDRSDRWADDSLTFTDADVKRNTGRSGFRSAWGDGHGLRATNWRGGTGAKNFYGGWKIAFGQF